MRYLFMFFALLVMVIPPAQATENRILTTDLHHFVNEANRALNHPNMNVGRNFLSRTTAENAVFENRVTAYNVAYNNAYAADPWHRVWYNQPAYGSYYRYPTNPYYNPTSMRSLKKWDHINLLENKRRTIPGYEAHLAVTGTKVDPYGNSAVIDVDMKEYSMAYSPYHRNLAGRVMQANSKCKMYLARKGDDSLLLTRMDCNTNTNLPF